MSIVILKGPQNRLYDIGGSMRPGGQPIHLTEEQVEKHKDVIDRILDEEVKKPEIIEEPKGEIKQYTKEELFDLNKAEQIELLNKYGITKIPRLEASRVKAILEAQK